MDITNTLAKLRIEELNAMQEAALAAILHTDRDVVVLAPTGLCQLHSLQHRQRTYRGNSRYYSRR